MIGKRCSWNPPKSEVKQELTELGGLIGGFKIDEESVKTSKFIDFLTVKILGHVSAPIFSNEKNAQLCNASLSFVEYLESQCFSACL